MLPHQRKQGQDIISDIIPRCMPFRMFEITSSGSQVILCGDELFEMLLTEKKKKKSETVT